jgi:CO/xanthine dehydrogenase Mo-binding subunit
MDALAKAAGMNPLEFRLANLTDERMRRVVERVAEMFGHEWQVAPSGRGFGLALGTDAGTFVAAAAEVTVDEARGRVQVERIVCAQDMGEVVNPEGAKIQMEGCLTMGLGYTLTEEIRFDKGVIFNENFDSYQLPEFSWLPKIEVDIIDNPELGPQGGGEPAITLVGAVVANAIHDATGARMYELPMSPGRVRRAIESG